MNKRHIFFTVLLMGIMIMSGCGPSAEQAASLTAAVWTATSPDTPTPPASPIPTLIPDTPTPSLAPLPTGPTEVLLADCNTRYVLKSRTISPDSKRVACAGGNSTVTKFFMVINGTEEKRYDNVGLFIFSPDSQRTAYRTSLSANWYVVVEAVEEDSLR